MRIFIMPFSLAFGLLSAAMVLPAQAQDTGVAAEGAAQNWLVTCTNQGTPEQLRCGLSQTVRVKETGARVLSVEIREPGGDMSGGMLISLPHGLYLPAGLTLTIDGGPGQSFPITMADQNGSYSEIALTDELLQALRAGSQLEIQVQSRAQQPLQFALSLDGFMAAEQLMP